MNNSSVNLHIAWDKEQSLPAVRAGAACAVFGGDLLVAGGTNWDGDTKCWLDRVDLYDFENGRWRDGPRLPRARAYGCCTVTEAGFEIVGGSDGVSGYQHSWLLQPGASTWQRLGDAPQNFVFAAAENYARNFYVFGGCDNDQDLASASDAVWMRDTGYLWRQISRVPQPGVVLSAHACAGGKVYFFGGCSRTQDGNVANHAHAFSFDCTRHEWARLRRLPSALRGASAVAIDNRRIIILGGYGTSFLETVLIYDMEQDSYQESNPLPVGVLGAHFVAYRGILYGADGEDQMHSGLSRLLMGRLSTAAIK